MYLHLLFLLLPRRIVFLLPSCFLQPHTKKERTTGSHLPPLSQDHEAPFSLCRASFSPLPHFSPSGSLLLSFPSLASRADTQPPASQAFFATYVYLCTFHVFANVHRTTTSTSAPTSTSSAAAASYADASTRGRTPGCVLNGLCGSSCAHSRHLVLCRHQPHPLLPSTSTHLARGLSTAAHRRQK